MVVHTVSVASLLEKHNAFELLLVVHKGFEISLLTHHILS